MRILLTSPTYPPYNSGIGNAAFAQATALSKAGFQVEVATGGQRGSQKISGVTVERFALTGADCWAQRIRGEVDEYLNFLRQGHWDTILLNGWQNWATDILLRHVDEISGRKILYSHCISTNSYFSNQPLKSCLRYLLWRPYWWRLRNYIERLDGMIFLAPEGVPPRFDDLAIAKQSQVPIWIVPNSLSEYALASLAIPLVPHEARDRLIAIGSYQWQKGFDFVIRAFAAADISKRFTLHLYGQEFSAYCLTLQALIKQLGLPEGSVVFHEGVTGNELISEYRMARLVLSGSYSECQPLALIDANAAGVPFIARNTGCVGFMAGGVVVSSWKEMARQICMLLDDSSMWKNLSDAGWQAAHTTYHPDFTSKLLLNALGDLKCGSKTENDSA